MKQTIKSTISTVGSALVAVIMALLLLTPATIVAAAESDAGNAQYPQLAILVKLNQKFTLTVDQTAEIQDFKNIRITLKEIVLNSPCALCIEGSTSCPPCPGKQKIGLDVNGMTRVYISEGEYADISGARIIFVGFEDENRDRASLIVKNIETNPNEIPVFLNEKFDLKKSQTAVVKDHKNLRIVYLGEGPVCAYTCPANAKCIPPPCSKGGIQLSVEMESGETMAGKEASLHVGEKLEAFGAIITLIDLKGGIALLMVNKNINNELPEEPPKPVPPTPIMPVCKYGGTGSEGWYIGNKLIAYDKCISVAQCIIGQNGIGWYSSLTGRLIQKGQCAVPVPIDIPNMPIQDGSQRIADNVPEEIPTGNGAEGNSSFGSSGQSGADYTTEMQTQSSNLAESELAESEVGRSILKKLQEDNVITTVTSIQQKEVDGRQVYDIHGTKTKKFLWIFPMQQSVTVSMDAGTQDIISNSK